MAANVFAAIRPVICGMSANVFAAIRPVICGMAANVFAAIRPGNVVKSPGTDRCGPMVGANHVGECIRRYSPRDLWHVGEFIRRYSPLCLRHTANKKPSPMAVGEGCAGVVMAGESLP